MHVCTRHCRRLALALPAVLLLAGAATADTVTWSGPDGGAWDTTTPNWTGDDTVYADGDSVRFYGNVAENIVIQAAGVAPGAFTIPSGGGGYIAWSGGDITGATSLTSGASGADAHFTRDGSYSFSGGLFAFGTFTYDPQLSVSGSTVHFGSDGSSGGGTITFSGGSFVFAPSQPATLDNDFVLSTNAGTISGNANASFSSDVAMGHNLRLADRNGDYSGLNLHLDGDRTLSLSVVGGLTPPVVDWTGAADGATATLTIYVNGSGVNAGAGFGGAGGWDVGNVRLTGPRRIQFSGDGTTFFDQVAANGGKVTVVDARLIKTVSGTGGAGTLQVGFPLEVLDPGTVEVTTVNVLADGTLSGDGSVLAPVYSIGGTLAPGAPVGALALGSLTLDPDSTTAIQVDGLSADQLAVSGTVALDGALTLLQLSPPPPGTITIIDNDGSADAVIGTFTSVPEGAVIGDDAGTAYIISYVGGDGNDVTLTPAAGVCEPCADYEATIRAGVCEIETTSYADWHTQVENLITGTIIAPVCDDGHPGGGSGTACADYIRQQLLSGAVCTAVEAILGP